MYKNMFRYISYSIIGLFGYSKYIQVLNDPYVNTTIPYISSDMCYYDKISMFLSHLLSGKEFNKYFNAHQPMLKVILNHNGIKQNHNLKYNMNGSKTMTHDFMPGVLCRCGIYFSTVHYINNWIGTHENGFDIYRINISDTAKVWIEDILYFKTNEVTIGSRLNPKNPEDKILLQQIYSIEWQHTHPTIIWKHPNTNTTMYINTKILTTLLIGNQLPSSSINISNCTDIYNFKTQALKYFSGDELDSTIKDCIQHRFI